MAGRGHNGHAWRRLRRAIIDAAPAPANGGAAEAGRRKMAGMPDEPVAFTLQDWLRDRGYPSISADVTIAFDWLHARLDQLPLHPADTRPLPLEAFGWNTAVDMIKNMTDLRST